MVWGSKLLIVGSLIVALGILGFGVDYHTEVRVREGALALEEQMLFARRQALEHQVKALLSALDALNKRGGDTAVLQDQARIMLGGVRFGQHGYLFVYDRDGTCIVHSGAPEIVGRTMDGERRRVVMPHLLTARAGGGFERYRWPKPGSKLKEDKLSYVALFKPWEWTVGTGDYLDDIARASHQLRERETANVRAAMWWVGAIATLALGLVFAGVFAPYLQERRRAREREIEVVMHEQGRISRELHDDVAQPLAAARHEAEAAQRFGAETPGGIPHLEDILAMIAIGQKKLREVAEKSHVPEFEEGLGVALKDYLLDFGRLARLKTELDTSGNILALTKPVAFELYRITQELLANVARHAGASHVKVSLSVLGRKVQLRVTDDGRGFPTGEDAGPPGFGLRNVRTRARHLGGNHSIESRPGETTILVTVPFYPGELA